MSYARGIIFCSPYVSPSTKKKDVELSEKSISLYLSCFVRSTLSKNDFSTTGERSGSFERKLTQRSTNLTVYSLSPSPNTAVKVFACFHGLQRRQQQRYRHRHHHYHHNLICTGIQLAAVLSISINRQIATKLP